MIRNPILYYALAPVLVGLWPLYVWYVSLPAMKKGLDSDIKIYSQAKGTTDEIWTLDPGRALDASKGATGGAFVYGEAVSRAADRCGIPARNYTTNAGNKSPISGKTIQEAKVTLTDVDVVKAFRFLSVIQSTWVNLECQSAKLTKRGDAPDNWDLDLSFKYTY
jgi:hypothetical protein